MHDYETAIFDAMATAMEALFQGVYVVSEDLPGDELHFPLVKLVAADISPDAASAESGDMEPRTRIEFQAECYSNRSRDEAKALAKACDELMRSWGWRRTSMMQVQNADRTIRRYVARWRGSVDAGGMVAR